MSYAVRPLADSISPDGMRLTTLEVTFPRFLLAEFNTHRVLSKNSASSRAIPTERIIKRVDADPFIPEFNKRVKGMGVGDLVDDAKQKISRMVWLDACHEALKAAQRLNDLGLDKSRVNRLLEPFMWHTVIVTGTEWSNFFALRCPPGEEVDIEFPAQPEFQQTAILMRRAMRESKPKYVDYLEWALPLVFDEDRAILGIEAQKLVSAGRCARVSYDRHGDSEPHVASIDRAEQLKSNGHMSPFEHQATPQQTWPDCRLKWSGNLKGWVQARKLIPNEHDFSKVLVKV